jgi:phosphoribosylaminoimidazole-succinocarboxamide synthase
VIQVNEQEVLLESHLPGIRLFSRGKVRDVYETHGGHLLIVATDRISAFDVVMSQGIPDKGKVLTQLSVFWFSFLDGFVPHHFITEDVREYPYELQPFASQLAGRSMLVKKTAPYPVECVVRGYLAGSGWKDYQKTGCVSGIKLPPGLQESSRLEAPIFTPATKAKEGHDENIDWDQMAAMIGPGPAAALREKSIAVYSRAREYAESRGVIIADTKFEWGLLGGEVILIDEVLTPDSSRFWPLDGYAPGRPQPSYDKQYVRDYLEQTGWDKTPPPPHLPSAVINRTVEKYHEAYQRLAGKPLNG